MSKYKDIYDKIGVWLSGLCIIHCILVPLLFLFYPAVGENIESHFLHSVFFLVIMAVAIVSFSTGYKLHKRLEPILYLISGLLILLINLLFHEKLLNYEMGLNVLGSLLVVISHIKNKKHCNKCNH